MRFDSCEQRLQADLLWAVESVDMMQFSKIPAASGITSTTSSPVAGELRRWLLATEHRIPLLDLIQQRQPRRLGIYFEVLWHYILEHYPGFEFLQRNMPVIEGKKTLGEMDFIYYCNSRQRHVHLETAVKFYLGLPANNPHAPHHWQHWIGPGCIDRLDIKLDKMLCKQTRLSTTSAGKTLLQEAGVNEVLREICLKGYFFYPLADHCPAPAQSHAHHARGYWLRKAQLDELPQCANWHLMKKEEWLAPVCLPLSHPLLSHSQLVDRIEERLSHYPFPLMVAQMNEKDDEAIEQQRFFITPDNWPQFESAT